MQEFGRERLEPIKAKNLAIPVGPALTAAGVSRYKSPLDVPVKLKWRPTKKPGVSLLVEATKNLKGGPSKTAGRVWYVLKKWVKIPDRHWLEISIRQAKNLVSHHIQNAINEHLNRGRK